MKHILERGIIMREKVEKFWDEHKGTVKNAALGITIGMAIVGVIALKGIKRLNQIIDENDLTDLFYGEDEE